MQWHVHGSDAGTGQKVTLALEELQATDAIHAAMAKGIVVTHVTRGPRLRNLSLGLQAAWTLALILAALCLAMYFRTKETQAELAAAVAGQSRVAGALAENNETISALQRRTVALEEAQGGAAKKLIDEVDTGHSRIAILEKEIDAANARTQAAEKHAADADAMRTDLTAAQQIATGLQMQLADQRRRIAELENAQATSADLDKTNKDLAGQVDLLKSQLLEQVAKAAAAPPPAHVSDPTPPPPRRLPWALRTSYDAAVDFVSLHFDKDSTRTAPGNEGTLVTTGLLGANAATLRLVHDVEKQRLYSATLTLSLASDAPQAKLAENMHLIGAFVRAFAPSWKDPDAWIADVARRLSDKDAADRALRLGDDYKLTVWHDRAGLFSWKIESPRSDLED